MFRPGVLEAAPLRDLKSERGWLRKALEGGRRASIAVPDPAVADPL